jgi:hypothetical protein
LIDDLFRGTKQQLASGEAGVFGVEIERPALSQNGWRFIESKPARLASF